MKKIDPFQHLAIAARLERYNSIFRTFWDIGEPILITDERDKQTCPTAAIVFDRLSGDPIKFIFNEDYWNECDDYKRCFIICHEMMHVMFRHGKRSIELKGDEICNFSMDIVVNEMLVQRFGFKRNRVKGWRDLFWYDTAFKDQPNVKQGESFEYYYNLFKTEYDKKAQELIEGLKSGKYKLVDTHGMTQEEAEQVLKDAIKISVDEDILNELKKHIDPNAVDEQIKEIGNKAGDGCGTWLPQPIVHVPKKLKWIKAAHKWRSVVCENDWDDVPNWIFHARRYNSFIQSNPNLCLQTEGRMFTKTKPKRRAEVALFLDVSGSCFSYRDRFWTAYKSMPPKYFDILLYTFDSVAHRIEGDQLYGGGGTCFRCIESELLKLKRYPDYVWVITDGEGSVVNPKYPHRWSWFLTSGGTTDCIPSVSTIYELSKFE